MSTSPSIPFPTYLAISNKKAQYGHSIDTKNWSALANVALPDATFKFCNPNGSIIEHEGGKFDFDSLKSFVTLFSKYFEQAQTLHMFGPPYMESQGEQTVKVRWAMEDQLCFGATAGDVAEIRGGGYYHETWVQRGEEWWLKELVLVRTYQKVHMKN